MISQVVIRREWFSTALLTTAVFCGSLAHAQATSESSPNAKYDHGLRHFYWTYSYDAPGHQRRDWYQESAAAWNEIYEDGRHNHVRIVDAHASVDGNTGVIVVGDTATLRVFIPDPDAHGSNPQWLRMQQQGATSWDYLGQLFEVSSSVLYSVCGVSVPNAGDKTVNPYRGQPSHMYLSEIFQGDDKNKLFLAWARRTYGSSWKINGIAGNDQATEGCTASSTFEEAKRNFTFSNGYKGITNIYTTLTAWPAAK